MTADLRSEVAGNRIRTWHLMPTDRMGPPPGASPPMRMTASWSGSNDPTAYKSAARNPRPMASSPRILNRQTGTVRRQATKIPCRRSSSLRVLRPQALRNTSAARRQAAKRCYRFGPLTPSARSANLIACDGMKNGFPGRVEDWRASWPRHPDRATFPAPSTSHAACGFPALRAPICFTSGLMGPIIPGQLSVRRVALDSC
jgi:hypothetical protein